MRGARALGAALILALARGPAVADVPPPVARPVPTADASVPFGTAAMDDRVDLAAAGYVEEEYFVTGRAKRYAYDDAFALRVVAEDVPYVTRILVRKPSDPRRFTGVVHLEPAHPQFGGASHWSATADYIVARGDGYVLATVGEDALTRGGPVDPAREPLRREMQARATGPSGALSAMRAFDPARYAPIDWPDDDAPRWDAFAGIAALLKQPAPGTPFDGYPVRRIYAAGWSFTGSLLRTFVNEGFHDRARDARGRPLIDGYVIGISASAFVSGVVAPTTGARVLPAGHPRRPTRAIDVPIVEILTENEASTNTGPQPSERDAGHGRHRLYEVAGLTHGDSLQRGSQVRPAQRQLQRKGLWSPPPPDPCPLERSDVPMDALARATLANLDAWVERGTPPPRASRIDFAAPRDEAGNRRGGVRLAELDVPLARYVEPGETDPPACRRPGPFANIRRVPLDPQEVAKRYATPSAYLAAFARRLDELVAERWLLRADADARLEAARARAAPAFGDTTPR